ncbi:MAG: creatininase family protein [Candidatus Brocadiae bacterium]|nr:creatininase family protein [Candidatus Brocadiia bacterium]
MGIRFSELRSPQIGAAAEAGAVVILPVGQTEEHGPHLPVNTDATIAVRVCEEAARELEGSPPCYVLDPICYGYSQKALSAWPGVFRLPQETVIATLTHILKSLVGMGFRKIVIASTHGHHDGVVRVAARALADECGVGPGVVFPSALAADVLEGQGKAGWGGSCHAGEFETSVMLHLAPELVDMSAAVPDDRLALRFPYSSSQAFVSTWTTQQSVSGAYGDPTVATAELGKLLFEKMATETARFVRYYHGIKQT